MDEYNNELWQPARVAPIGSPVRSRAFWLSVLLGPEGNQDDRDTLVWYHASVQLAVGPFKVSVAPFMTSLYWARDWLDGQKLLAWVDDAHPTPVVFRWQEALAIAQYLEGEERYVPYPSEPSLTLLLLAPFVRVTSFDDVAGIEQELRRQIGQLGLLKEVEVEEALGRILPSADLADRKDFVPFRWEMDEHVGWRQHGGIETSIGDKQVFLGNHSLRHADNSDFPAADFVDYLRSVGIDDL